MTSKNMPVKVAMIGLGWWGKKMTAVLKKASDDIEIVCAAEPNGEGEAFATANGFKRYADFAGALSHPGVEAVILATPHSLHAEQIEQAVAAGKHIFCEKPLALTKAGAEAAVKACAAAGLVLGMGHERRWEPPVADMLEKARSGVLGRIQQVEGNFSHDKFTTLDTSNWRLNAAEAPVGGMTATGTVVGTPEYMAPEQVSGRAVDARTDIYALGAVLYHALCGRPPFQAATAIATTLAQLNDPPTPPRALVPELSETWETLVLQALEKDPERRFPTAQALKARLPAP